MWLSWAEQVGRLWTQLQTRGFDWKHKRKRVSQGESRFDWEEMTACCCQSLSIIVFVSILNMIYFKKISCSCTGLLERRVKSVYVPLWTAGSSVEILHTPWWGQRSVVIKCRTHSRSFINRIRDMHADMHTVHTYYQKQLTSMSRCINLALRSHFSLIKSNSVTSTRTSE